MKVYLFFIICVLLDSFTNGRHHLHRSHEALKRRSRDVNGNTSNNAFTNTFNDTFRTNNDTIALKEADKYLVSFFDSGASTNVTKIANFHSSHMNTTKQNITTPDATVPHVENISTRRGEKKARLEKVVQKKDETKAKAGISAIVVIGNKTRRISGPVVKHLLSELQRQNVEEMKQQKVQSPADPQRVYAANEVAEINRLLGKPLTDVKALGLIKNLLLDKVHSHLAKTMEVDQQTDAKSPLDPPTNPAPLGTREGVHGVPQSPLTLTLRASTCRDVDPAEKCQYLKSLGLCKSNTQAHVGRRCQETCGMCENVCADCTAACSGCTRDCTGCNSVCASCPPTQLPAPPPPPSPPPSPPPPLPHPSPYAAYVPPPPPPAAPMYPPYLPTVHTPISSCTPGCDWKVEIYVPFDDESKDIAAPPCPDQCKNRHPHHTTNVPVFHRTTPHPLVVLSDNTPLPGRTPHLPNATPTPHAQTVTNGLLLSTDAIGCGTLANVHHPTLCPPLLSRTAQEPEVAVVPTTHHMPTVHRSTLPTVLPIEHSTTVPSGRLEYHKTTLHPSLPHPSLPHSTTPHPSKPLENLKISDPHPSGDLLNQNLLASLLHPQPKLPTSHPSLAALKQTTVHSSALIPKLPTAHLPLPTALPALPSRNPNISSDLTLNLNNQVIQVTTTLLPLIERLPGLPAGSVAAAVTPDGMCQHALDIGIAIDTSAATVPHMQQIRQFAKSLVDKFQMGGVSRIGVITFDTIAKVPIKLETYEDPNALKEHINKLVADPYGRRRTDAALDAAKDKLFVTGRSGVPKVLFFLEHGKINGGDPSINWSQMLLEPAERLREMGVNIFAVGATPIATFDELKTISSTADLDQSHIFPLQSYGQLPNIIPPMAMRACRLAEPTLTPPGPLGPNGCPVNFAKVGCYNDDQNNPRPLPEQIMNDRGMNYPGFSGKKIDWDHWNTYLPELVCRCAIQTKLKGYKVFGIQFFAACWSGPTAGQTYMEDGEGDPDLCISSDYRKCEATDQFCVGKQETNFVYTLDAEAKRSHIPQSPGYRYGFDSKNIDVIGGVK